MRFKAISDLHVDINYKYIKDMKFDSDAFYLIAGDVSGDRFITEKFLKEKNIKGVFIEGNHLGYNSTGDPKGDTKDGSIKYLKNRFMPESQMSFLENDHIIVDNKVIIGATLYTDFELFGNPSYSMRMANLYMNDFRYVTTISKNQIRRITPNDYVKRFKKTIKYIDSTYRLYPDYDVIVVTHHAPSIKGISSEYIEDALTPAYASNLEQFIIDRPRIKYWIHGHVHHINQYEIGNTKVICNPMGYYNENNMNLEENLGVDLDF